jgi:hypothetical protein
MKRERLTKLAGVIVFGLIVVLPFPKETFAETENPRGKAFSKIQKSVKKQGPTKSNTSADTLSKQANKPLGHTINLSALTPDTPFGEAISIFRDSTEPPLRIIVLWRDLSENADIDRDTPIGMESISGISLGKNLELLLMSVSAASPAKLGYVVEKGVIIIATKDSLPRKMIKRVYNVTDLLSAPANYFYPGGFRSPYMGFYGRPYGGYGRPYGGAYGLRSPYGRTNDIVDLIGAIYRPSRRTGRRR